MTDDPPLSTSSKTHVAHHVLVTAAVGLLVQLTSLISGPILARTLGPLGRGTVAAILSPLFFFAEVGLFGLAAAATYLSATGRYGIGMLAPRLCRLAFSLGIIAYLAIFQLAPLLLRKDITAVPILRIAAVALPLLMATTVLRGVLLGHRHYWAVNLERATGSTIRLGALLFLMFSHLLNPSTAVAASVVDALLASLVLVIAYSRIPKLLKSNPTGLWRNSISFGARSWGGSLGAIAVSRADQLLLAPLAGIRQLGLYVVAVSIAEVPGVLIGAVRTVLFSEQAGRPTSEALERASRLTILLSIAYSILGILTVRPVLGLVFGRAFAPAVPMAVILLVASIPGALRGVLGTGISALGYPGRESAVQVFSGGLTVATLALIVPRYGAIGAAWASLGVYAFSAAAFVLLLSRRHRISPTNLLVPRISDLVWVKEHLVPKLSETGFPAIFRAKDRANNK